MKWNGGVLIGCGFLLGIVAAATVIASIQTPKTQFDLETLGKLAGILVALFTLGLVLFTAWLARETGQLWRENRRPLVVVTIEPTDWSLIYMQLVIENVGTGTAFDIEAKPATDMVIKRPNRSEARLSETTILRQPTLKPRQKIVTFLGAWNEISPTKTEIESTCKDVSGEEHHFRNTIDLAPYYGIIRHDDPVHKMADEVERVRKAIENIASGWRRVEVNTHTSSDRAAEEVEQSRRMKESMDQLRQGSTDATKG